MTESVETPPPDVSQPGMGSLLPAGLVFADTPRGSPPTARQLPAECAVSSRRPCSASTTIPTRSRLSRTDAEGDVRRSTIFGFAAQCGVLPVVLDRRTPSDARPAGVQHPGRQRIRRPAAHDVAGHRSLVRDGLVAQPGHPAALLCPGDRAYAASAVWWVVLVISIIISPTKQGIHDRFSRSALVRPAGPTIGGRSVVSGCTSRARRLGGDAPRPLCLLEQPSQFGLIPRAWTRSTTCAPHRSGHLAL